MQWMDNMSQEIVTGRAKGGVETASRLTKVQLKERAEKAAAARWSGDIKDATHGSPDHPLKIGEIQLPCYVLTDETRVLSQRGMLSGLGIAKGSSSGGGDRLVGFLSGKAISPYVSKELMTVMTNPIKFRSPNGGGIAFGYPATMLADICDTVLAARAAGALQKQQEHIAAQCEILVRGFARVGIIALVDEATGYQRDRKRDALAEILEAFIDKELQPWLPTFDSDFYEGIFRLRGLNYEKDTVKRPMYFGHITNDIVYKRLAPGVLEELKKVTPKDSTGRYKHQLFRRLTTNKGYPSLKQLLGSIVTMMKLSSNWQDFMDKLNKIHPRYGETYPLPLENDTGKGL